MSLFRITFAAAALLTLTHSPARAQHPADRPHDLILAVDVSLSMVMPFEERGRRFPANDREGIRWDALQFTLDVAGDDDRVALVLYRAENVVLTRYLDPSGFVSLARAYPDFGGKTGRRLLGELVAELQRTEERWARAVNSRQRVGDEEFRDFELTPLAGRAGGRFRLAHGTASLLALKTAAELLPRARPEATTWAFLFTDGHEVRRDEGGPQYRRQDYAYIDARAGLTGPRLDAWAAPWAAPFRKAGVPLFTFALGDSCDLELLQSLARQGGASFNPRTNAAMLDDLQQLQWGLRGYWLRHLRADFAAGGREAFSVPRAAAWRDLGVLLHREIPGETQPRARAPLPDHMKPPRVGGHDLADLTPRVSRSHWYYHLTPDVLSRAKAPADGDLELLVKRPAERHGDYTTHAVAALRPPHPLFTLREPADGGVKFTPRDAIPFRVEFHPPEGQSPFRAEDFRVEATVTPALSPAASKPNLLRLELDRPVEPSEPRQFRGQLILDDAPDSAGLPQFVGPYHVDVTITGTRGPLAGATRRLPRRTLDIGPYPTLRLPRVVELTNDGPDAARRTIELTLSQPTDPEAVQTNVAVAVTDGPLARGRVVPPEAFRVGGAKTGMIGKNGSLTVELAPAAWTSLPVGDYRGGSLTVKLPWQKQAETVELVVRRRPYPITARPDVFRLDLAARDKGAVTRAVECELKTGIVTEERVWLSATPRAAWKLDDADRAAPEPDRVEFEQVEDEHGVPAKGKRVAFRVGGLGETAAKVARTAKDPRKASLPFTLLPEGEVGGGAFRATLYLVGPGVAPTPVTVFAVVNPVSVTGRGGKPLDELHLLGLAGSAVRHTLTFAAPRKAASVTRVTVAGKPAPLVNGSLGGWDRLPLRAEPAGPASVALALDVPACVQEGKYRTDLVVDVDYIDGPEGRSMKVSLPVYLEVLHRGVRVRQGGKDLIGPLRLRFPEGEPCADVASAEVELHTDARESPVRWSARRAKTEKGTDADAESRLDLLFGGASVLDRRGPSNPIRRDSPVTLKVTMSRKGLAPGLYRAAVQFDSYEDTGDVKPSGGSLANTLEVEMLVPGRSVEVQPPAKAPFRGETAEILVRVTCHDCGPGAGELVALDKAGQPVGAAVQVAGRPTRAEPDVAVTGVRHYTYVVPVTASRVGTNTYEVRWPDLCPASGPRSLTRRVAVDAAGMIEATPRLAHAGEEVTLKATVHPSRRPAAAEPLVLHVVSAADREISVELFDDGKAESGDEHAGDGVYSAKHRFPEAGRYEVLCPADSAAGPLRLATVEVAFELGHVGHLGALDRGAPEVPGGLLGREELSEPKMLHLVNRRSEALRWRARLLAPTTLDVSLIGAARGESGMSLAGTLGHDQALDLGIEARLPPRAEDGTSHFHLEVDLEWIDRQGAVVGRRSLRLPLSLTTRDWLASPRVWILGVGAVAVVGLVGHRVSRRLLRRRSIAAPAVLTPVSRSLLATRREDEGIPEHMR